MTADAGFTGGPAQPDLLRRVVAEVELAAAERADGDATAAANRLRDALALADESPADVIEVRPTILLRLGDALGDLNEFEAAANAYKEAARAAERSPDPETKLAGDLAAERGRINAMVGFGEYAAVVDAANALLERYAGLLADGRDDLIADRAGLRGVLGRVLFLIGDVPAAAAAKAEAGAELSGLTGKAPRSAGDELTRQAAQARAILDVRAEQVPQYFHDLQREFESAKEASQAGRVAEASYLLEETLATGLAVADRRPTQEIVRLCGEMGLAVGVMANYAHRDAAAVHAFNAAGRCFLGLYAARRLPVHLDLWCDTRIGLGSVFLIRGDQGRVDAVLDEVATTVRSLDRRGSKARIARVRKALDSVGSSLGPAR